MKCSKCGEQCRKNQAFCIKCGSPMQVVPDFNLIEAELANNVGQYLNEGEYANHKENNDLDIIDIDREDDNKLKNKKIVENDEPNEDWYTEVNKTDNDDLDKSSKKKKKLIIGISIAVVVIVAIITLSIIFIRGNTNSFINTYNEAIELYENDNYDGALSKLLEAQKIAKTTEEKIKVKEALWETYKNIGDKDEEIIELLKELIKLDSKEVRYYEELVILYLDNGMEKEANSLINSVKDPDIYEVLSVYGIAAPIASQKSGEYDQYLTIELTSSNAEKIYYTIDGTKPTQTSTLYENPIEIKTEGKTTLKTLAVSKSGMESVIATYEYEITLSELEAPKVTPESGNFTSNTKISITTTEGITYYYTLDGSAPSEKSTVYTEPVDMPRGNNVFNVIAINENGVKSAVVTKIYNLQVSASYTAGEAIDLLKEYFIDKGYVKNKNDESYEFEHIKTTIIDNNEYYIIKSELIDGSGNPNLATTNYFGVDTIKGTIKKVSLDSNGKYFITN